MSNGLVLPFLRQVSDHHDWSQSELAEFYRVESALLQAGFVVATDRGVSDEGDPWFVFCRADNEEVIAHFARINREYVVVSSFHSGAVCGRDLRELIRKLLDSNPMTLPMRRSQGQKVFLHPAALLTALVASAYVVSNEKQLGGDSGANDGHHSKNSSIISLLMEKFSVFAAAALAATWIEQHTGAIGQFFEKMVLFHAVPDEHVAHAASKAPDGSALDAILHAIQNVELGHRVALASDDSNLQVSHQEHEQGIIAPSLKQLPSPTAVAGDKAADLSTATFADGNTGASFADNASSHVDGSPTATVQPSIATHLVGSEFLGQPEASSQLVAAESAQSSASGGDALQLTLSVIGNQSLQSVVLSGGTAPEDQALQQALLHTGVDVSVVPVVAAPSVGTSNDAASTSAATSGGQGAVGSNPLLATLTQQPGSYEFTPQQMSGNTTEHLTESAGLVTQILIGFAQETPSYAVQNPAPNIEIWSDTNVADEQSPDYGSVSFEFSGSTVTVHGLMSNILGIINGLPPAAAA